MSDCLKGSALQLITRKTLRKTALEPVIMQRWCETHLIGSAYIATTCNYPVTIPTSSRNWVNVKLAEDLRVGVVSVPGMHV